METTGGILVERTNIDVVPAELSATDHLRDFETHWIRLAA